jgi:hypothetical protein
VDLNHRQEVVDAQVDGLGLFRLHIAHQPIQLGQALLVCLFADQNVTFRATSPVAGRTRVSWRIVAALEGTAAMQATAPATPRKNKRRESSRDKAVAPCALTVAIRILCARPGSAVARAFPSYASW